MSRTEDRLQAKSELHEKIARMIWEDTEPAAMVVDWEQASSDDRAVCLELANKIIASMSNH